MTQIEVLTYAKRGVRYAIRDLCSCIGDGAVSDKNIDELSRLTCAYFEIENEIQVARQEEAD